MAARLGTEYCVSDEALTCCSAGEEKRGEEVG